MPSLAVLLLLLLYNVFARAQNIDSLQTSEQILSLVNKLYIGEGDISLEAKKSRIEPYSDSAGLRESQHIPFQKGDFDGNGYTDLLFNGFLDYGWTTWCKRISLVILSFGKDSFQLRNLSFDNFARFCTARSITIEGQTHIEFFRLREKVTEEQNAIGFGFNMYKDTLACAWGQFIEKRMPSHDTIQRIRLSIMATPSSPGAFIATISRDSVRWENKLTYNEKGEIVPGEVLIAPLPVSTRDTLFGLLNSINFRQLRVHYRIIGYDFAFARTCILYNNNQLKSIDDYGVAGTEGLCVLYTLIQNMRSHLQWKEIGKATNSLQWDCID